MKKQILTIALVIILSFESYSQIVFEKGYFINNSNQKIECLIKNVDWRNNPSEFEYKLNRNDLIKKASIQTVKEFGIYNVSKYIRSKVRIDMSPDRLDDDINNEMKPDFKQKVLFLKVLIEGEASLFLYVNDYLTRFFYKLNDSEIKQLIYKKYLVNDEVRTDEHFKKQLFLDLKCKDLKLNDFENIRYKPKDLERIFIKYNNCKNSNYSNYDKKQKQKKNFHLIARLGRNFGGYFNTSQNYWKNYEDRYGIEGEYILPYNKNKWSLLAELTYRSFYYKQKINNDSKIYLYEIDYKSIELPIGIRHYFYLDKNSKIFINIQFVFDFPSNNSFVIFSTGGNFPSYSLLSIISGGNIALGFGYKFKNMFEVEMRYNTSRELLEGYYRYSVKYRTFSIIIGISLL